jgi:hypothetical protein
MAILAIGHRLNDAKRRLQIAPIAPDQTANLVGKAKKGKSAPSKRVHLGLCAEHIGSSCSDKRAEQENN